MATITPERTVENDQQVPNMVDVQEDYEEHNPFLSTPSPQTAQHMLPPLPPRESPTQTGPVPSAPRAEAALNQERSLSTRSDFYMDDSSLGNPFQDNASTSAGVGRWQTGTVGANTRSLYPSVRSPPTSSGSGSGGATLANRNSLYSSDALQPGHPSAPSTAQGTANLAPARGRGDPSDMPSDTRLARQEPRRRPSASPVPTRNTPSPVQSPSVAGKGGKTCGAATCSVPSDAKSPVPSRRPSTSSNDGATGNRRRGNSLASSNDGVTDDRRGSSTASTRPSPSPTRTPNRDSGKSAAPAAAAAAAAAAAMAVATPPTQSGGGRSSATTAMVVATPSPAAQVQTRREPQTSSWNWHNIGRLFGAMMGNAMEQKNARDAKSGSAKVVRVLTPHTMQQTPDGRYGVSVCKKLKPGSSKVQVTVGVYDTAYEGQRAAEAFSPPVWHEAKKNSTCAVCNNSFGFITRRRHHCRNCGRLVCSNCSEASWPRSMLPPTYTVDNNEKKVRVCDTCYKANEIFRKALLSGSEERVMEAYSTGCINLRTPFTIYHNELPVHCAAAGGNLNILAWLIEDRCCPLFLDRDKKVALGDSRKQSVMGAAAACGHIQIMRYLIFTQGCKVTEIKSMHTLWGALEKCLYEGSDVLPGETKRVRRPSGTPGGGDGQGPYELAVAGSNGNGGAEVAAAVGDEDNMCIVCFERKVNCTLVPCGHLCCCMDCAAQFDLCPVCRAPVDQKIKAITV